VSAGPATLAGVGRWRRRGLEGLRFTVVGAAATVVALFGFNLMLHGLWLVEPPLGGWPITSYVIANTVGMVVAYVGSRAWAFKHREAQGRDGGIVAFTVINVVTMAIPVAFLWFSRGVLGLSDPLSDNISANVLGLGLGMVARFYLFRKFVFTRAEPTTGPSSADPSPAPARAAGAG
jgi:putative flippase GtrA